METVYIVQAFSTGKRGRVVADKPLIYKTEDEAVRRAAKLADTVRGVIAFAQTADPELGDYSEPVVLATHGDVPDMG
jgi:hypothetical protein